MTRNEFEIAKAELEEARAGYLTAETNAQAASKAQTAALNRLNAAQKAFLKQIESVRAAQPRDSDWGRNQELRP